MGGKIHRMADHSVAFGARDELHQRQVIVNLCCNVLLVLPHQTLVSLAICSVLFRCAYELLFVNGKGQKSSTVHLSGKIVEQCNSLRRRKGVHDRC